jgi:hypothetical protein
LASRNLKGATNRCERPLTLTLSRKRERGSDACVDLGCGGYEQPLVVPQLTHLWQLPLGIMIDPHSGQVGASVRAMKL